MSCAVSAFGAQRPAFYRRPKYDGGIGTALIFLYIDLYRFLHHIRQNGSGKCSELFCSITDIKAVFFFG